MFENNGDHVTVSLNIPVTVDTLLFFALLGGVAIVIVLVLAALNNGKRLLEIFKPQHEKPSMRAVTWMAMFISPFWLALLILTLIGTFRLWLAPPDIAGEPGIDNALAYRVHFLAIVGLMTALAGLIGAPLALIRVFATERQTKAAEDGLITDRINKAVEGLGAEKTVKQVFETPRYRKDAKGEWVRDENGDPVPALRPDGKPIVDRQVVEQSVPNLEVRIGAIYALERIAKHNPDEHIQIMEILTAYIRQNAPASEAPDLTVPPEWFDGENEKGETWERAFGHWKTAHSEMFFGIKPRADIQVAITVIGRRSEAQKAIERGEWKPFDEAVPPWPDWPENQDGMDAYRQGVDAHRAAVAHWAPGPRRPTGSICAAAT